MAKKPVLVVLAAGMGSRYGGLKQIDPVGCCGEAILDYSLYDAHEAGFETAVIIIKEAIKKDFMETVGKRLENCPMEIRYAYQELDKLPAGYTVPADRTKPWGTSHAILCAREAIDGAPFAVVNADDYYGKSAYKVIYDYLCQAQDGEKYDYAMVGYRLDKTVTDNGSVARGVCETDENGYLTSIVERTQIEKYENGIRFTTDGGETWTDVAPETTVSMNLWGYTPGFIDEIEAKFPAFLDATLSGNAVKAEFFLPGTVGQLLEENRATVKVLRSPDKWYGVTYAADKPGVVAALKAMSEQGLYPADGLWTKK
ncbi:MAG: NTP transferase domain-containing protein [Oscillospiraceae bacterium]|nr:NTP transferase domain-containing protein [Oscillospiraceae bacterium]